MQLCNLYFILFNIFYISSVFNYVSVEASSDKAINGTNDIIISYESECRALCESCDCKGFFCGDNECICECNSNINGLNKYAECLKDIIKDNYYKYNISVQHLNVSSNDKKSDVSKNAEDTNKTIKKRSITWSMLPEGTNMEKEKKFMADSSFALPPLSFDKLVGSTFSGFKGLGDTLGLPSLPNLGNVKAPEVAAQTPTILAAPAKDQVAAASPVVAAVSPLVAAAPPVVASPDPTVSAIPTKDIQIDTPVGSAADDNVGIAAIKAKGIKALEIGKLAGLLGKIKGIKIKALAIKKGGLLGDAADGPVGAAAPIITQPAQTR